MASHPALKASAASCSPAAPTADQPEPAGPESGRVAGLLPAGPSGKAQWVVIRPQHLFRPLGATRSISLAAVGC